MKQRIVWIDVLKVLTMLLVILGHCNYLSMSTPYGGVDYFSQIDGNTSAVRRMLDVVTHFIYAFHMPLFMAMSGACLRLAGDQTIPFSSMVKKKWKRLIVPFFLTSLLVSIPLKYISGYWSGSANVVKDIVFGQLFLMGNSHLWFIVALFWIFIEHRLLLSLKVNLKSPVTLCILFAVSILGYHFSCLYEFMGIFLSLKFLVYFTIGYSFIHDIDKLNFRLSKSLIAMAAFFIGLYVCDNICRSINAPGFVYILLSIPYAIIGMLLMVAISKQLANNAKFVGNKVYNFFKRDSYDLYLYSDPFNYVIICVAFNVIGGGGF